MCERHPFVCRALLGLAFITGCYGVDPEADSVNRSEQAPSDVDTPSGDRATASVRRRLTGHLTSAMRAATVFGRVPASTPISLTIGLRLRDPQALRAAVEAVSDPASPGYRQYMTPEQFGERFGVSESDYQRVVEWARSKNLRVETHPNRLMVSVSGSTADVEAALSVHFHDALRPDGTRFYEPDTEPSLDADVPVAHISNLENYARARHAVGSGPGGTFRAPDFRKAYASCTGLTGAGQSIGLYLGGDNFNQADVTAYANLAGLTGVPVVQSIPANSAGTAAVGVEATLDVEMATTMAPGAQVVAFTGSADQILGNMARNPQIKQFSSSYFPVIDPNVILLVTQLALQGQSFFEASGDDGADPPNMWSVAQSDFRQQPTITVVGGTALSMNGAGAAYSFETAWSSSSGGTLTYTTGSGDPIPWYQVGLATSANQASSIYRNMPDISMVAQDVSIYLNGAPAPVAGTSVAAPLWAGFIALVNQEAQANGQAPIGFANPALYTLAKTGSYGTLFNDVTRGSTPNRVGYAQSYSSTTGYDLTTGLGTPRCDLIYALGAPQVYPTRATNDRYWHDSTGSVYHQNSRGDVNLVLPGSLGIRASSSIASYSYPINGQTAWFFDTGSPQHLRQIYSPTTGSPVLSDWGTAPSGCTWVGNPAVSTWGEGRADMYATAFCSGQRRIFHETWEYGRTYPWMDITPPGVQIGSSPAALSREVGVLDVIAMNSNSGIVHGSCTGACNGAAFVWDVPSARMNQGPGNNWFGEPALASPSPGVLRAFNVDFHGNVDFSQWSLTSPTWTASSNWYSPPSMCTGLPGGPAVTTSGQNNLFVACTTVGGQLFGGWGDTSLSGTWWFMANGVAAGAGLSAH